jgi:hypothetical protein
MVDMMQPQDNNVFRSPTAAGPHGFLGARPRSNPADKQPDWPAAELIAIRHLRATPCCVRSPALPIGIATNFI